MSQALATAFADGDWAFARELSPQVPEWSDRKFEEGFAGLESVTVFLAASEVTGEPAAPGARVDLWLAQVAHESTSGRHTSFYCVHWATLEDSAERIERIGGIYLRSVPEFQDPTTLSVADLQACDHFDTAPPVSTPSLATPRQPPPAPPSSSPPPVYVPPLPSPDLRNWTLLSWNGGDYLCQIANYFTSDYDCFRYYGGAPSIYVGTPDLKCTKRFAGFDCTDGGYYPSEIDGYTLSTIGSDRVLCRDGECWIWNSYESPRLATMGPIAYRCDVSGRCVRQ